MDLGHFDLVFWFEASKKWALGTLGSFCPTNLGFCLGSLSDSQFRGGVWGTSCQSSSVAIRVSEKERPDVANPKWFAFSNLCLLHSIALRHLQHIFLVPKKNQSFRSADQHPSDSEVYGKASLGRKDFWIWQFPLAKDASEGIPTSF